MPKITVEKFLSLNEEKNNFLKVRLITDSIGMNNEIISYEVNRPGMALFGYFKDFAFERIQIFGKGEGNYVLTLAKENRLDIFEELFKYKMPLCIFTYNLNPPESFIKIAEKNNVCVIISELKTMDVIRNIENLIEEELIESHTVHGGLVEVFGVGVLILGKSGVGKSEATLELISKGHRLISDDTVEFKKLNDGRIIGRKNEFIKHNMEVRGIGVVDISRLSGMSAIRDKKRLDLVIELENWNDDEQYDRMGLEEKTYNILNTEIPYIKIPVRSGRNICILIETAAKNFRLKEMGYNSAKELNKNLIAQIEKKKANNSI
ncbi:HPr(Ser) kinase/phosphatase [Brachyspira aalborgi]|jgi:HPr kinase/phosphorylase|uniref:HPr kinase/phosphorylase n=1 Tax=Brachyspira aalborgi TaxID=29522 RepID=A0AB38Q0E8_9SPIR|nr:HPr(Ser) kinase/phosphatase [Brachyspira aalborgi]MBS4764081.1 HPr(Ser) kinase/phosphatase [Brachyspira sp.]CCY78724.1 hPr kinase/phosphorylase [Brachyspira sp. CAG:700]TXJ15904.1 HPr(Ser) kinase/phosphatase [Brachyspira aalborgi]TXJ19404.1 HPr(Ser) kinase/phosphatase [Brachyspira aalborgi]TXJ26155.1 HPr(Ser) kinase/phosphatase [Brachyspira aalborgi]